MLKLSKKIFIVFVFIFLITLDGHASDHSINFKDFSFWRMMEGYWEAKNTYFDSDMNYIIRSYSSLIIIKLDNKNYFEKEYRFYPYSIAADRYGKGLVKEGEGIEVIVSYSGKLIDDKGTMGNTHADHVGVSSGDGIKYKLLSDKDSLRANRKAETIFDSYRLYTTFTSPNHKFRSNFGLYYETKDKDPGSMRAFILSQDHRIGNNDFEERRNYLRNKYNIKVVSSADPKNIGQSYVYRLE